MSASVLPVAMSVMRATIGAKIVSYVTSAEKHDPENMSGMVVYAPDVLLSVMRDMIGARIAKLVPSVEGIIQENMIGAKTTMLAVNVQRRDPINHRGKVGVLGA
jgi:hypothetical protein